MGSGGPRRERAELARSRRSRAGLVGDRQVPAPPQSEEQGAADQEETECRRSTDARVVPVKSG
jgi:hypothetical protein